MSFEIQQHAIEDIAVLELHGRLTLGAATRTLQDEAAKLLSEGSRRAILDFASAPSIDSSGLGVLVAVHSDFQKAGGAVKLLNLSKRHIQLLVLTKLSTVFEIFDDERAAVDSFFPDRAQRRFDILDFVRSQEPK
jgi:anti-sigma B factor antagonist